MSDLPLVLCGPMIRRVSATSAGVFLVLRQHATVELRVSVDGEEVMYGAASTRQIGERLHVVMVRASATNGPVPAGTWCDYGLWFTQKTKTRRLIDPGVLGEDTSQPIDRLSYSNDDESGPGFMTPPAEPTEVRVLHGSCRKPHGRGVDALVLGDRITERARLGLTNAGPIPQQLLLTGDQIYADDVHPLILTAIHQVETALFGTAERAYLAGQYGTDTLQPGKRGSLVTQVGKLTSGSASSHLITFGEFIAMYLLVWSPTAWFYVDMATQDAIAKHEKLGDFRGGLLRIRRLLANVPTYTIFDDHEVTDDWNLRADWQARVGARPLGRRILRNALAAYAVFQHWGNLEGDLPTALLKSLPEGDGTLPDSLDGLLGGLANAKTPGSAMDWSWRWRGPVYQLVGLDTRTRRVLEGDTLGLLSAGGIDGIFGADQGRDAAGRQPAFRLVMSAAPLLGFKLIERLQGLATSISEGLADWADAEPWSGTVTHDKMINHLLSRAPVAVLSGDVHYGFVSTAQARSGAYAGKRIINFTASALRNESAMTYWGPKAGRDRLEAALSQPGVADFTESTYTVTGDTDFEVVERIEGVLLDETLEPSAEVRLEANTDDARGAILGFAQLGDITLSDGHITQTLHYRKSDNHTADSRADTLKFPLGTS